MKKVINILIILTIALTAVACSSETSTQKTEEELRAEVKAEMEAEAKLKEQIKAELKDEIEKEQQKDEISMLKGRFTSAFDVAAARIVLDKPIMIDDREISEVCFNEDVVTNLVPRKYFTYYMEGGTSIDEKYYGNIPIQVEVDPESYKYDEEFGETHADIKKVISVDGEENPTDKTDNEYPLEYYKAVFYTYCYMGNKVIPKDVKETYYYNNLEEHDANIYKTAVDKILESGLYINMAEGEYYIEDEPKTYSDGEVDTSVPSIEQQKNQQSDESKIDTPASSSEKEKNLQSESEAEVITPNIVEEVSEPEVEVENDYTQGYTFQVDENGLNVTYNNTGNTETIVKYQQYDVKHATKPQSYPGYYIGKIKNPKYSPDKSRLFFLTGNNEILSYDFEDKNIYAYIFKSGNSMVTIKDYTLIASGQYAGYYGILTTNNEHKLYDSNCNEVMDIESIYADNITELKYDGSQNIKGYSSEKVNGKTVKYSDCIAVVIPQYSGKYKDSLTKDSVLLGAISETPSYEPGETHAMVMGPQKVWKDSVNFAVVGTIDNITIKYIDDSNNKTETATRQNVTNKLITVGTNFTNDRTRISVSFTTKLPDGKTYKNSFNIDDMRDVSEYKTIMVKFE